MSMKRKFKLKSGALKVLKILGVIIAICLVVLIVYRMNINTLKELGYSEKAANKILFSSKKAEVVLVGKSKTLNKAFESEEYKEKNFTSYSKIKYHKGQNLIKNINTLIKKGYNNEEINIILAHGTDKDVTTFSKKNKVRYLEEFYSYPFAKIRNYERYVKYMNESREDEETSVIYVNMDLDKENYKNPIKVKEFSYDMLVNKHRVLSSKFIPDQLVKISTKYASEKNLKGNKVAVLSAEKMIDAAKKEGQNLIINSAYRSYKDQAEIVDTYQKLYGDSYIEKYVLRPGFSEHQTGLGFDIGSKDSKIFIESSAYKWMESNCHKFGFIHRFKTTYEDITGIKSEAWHYRYVGKKIAKYCYNNDMSLEEYYARKIDK